MSFGTVFAYICTAYFIYYAGMIIYDIRFKKVPEDAEKVDEEEVDITDIAPEVIRTRDINKESIDNYIQARYGEEKQGRIESMSIFKVNELQEMVDNLDPDDNPFKDFSIPTVTDADGVGDDTEQQEVPTEMTAPPDDEYDAL